MADMTEFQSRLTQALDRIGSGLEGLEKPIVGEGEEALRAALEEERTANAQLEERVRAIKEKQDTTVATLAAEVDRLRELLGREEAQLSRLSRVNEELRGNNQALRDAMTAGVAEPHLINKAMMAQLESVRAAQAADRLELDGVLGELNALVQDAAAKAEKGEQQDA
ncbi:MAG: hypothetical protein CR993_04175 [Rhodobacterales bacterium]|nr:MAG: hypothetical protein CR993_04175 [Rhodobacterales bacterium]